MRSMYKKQGDSYIPITPIPNGEEVVSNDENVQQKTKKPISKTTAIIGVIVIFVAFALFLKTTTFKYSSEPIVGEWYCTDVIDLGKASDAANNATLDKDTTLYINADGTYRITRDGEEGNVFIVEANGKWKPMSEENSIKSYSVGDDNQVVMLHCPNGYGTDIRELLFVMNAANSEKGSYTLEYTRVYR